MPQTLVVTFNKMHGAGNDFIVLDNRFFYFSDEELSDLARRFCPRRTGIGADGLLALAASQEPDTHFHMRYFNADGSRGEMCGNGARCLAWFAYQAGLQHERLRFSTDAGIHVADVLERDRIRLHVPDPREYQADPPVEAALQTRLGPIHHIDTGVPHAVCFVGDVETAPVVEVGPALRRDPAFPEGANVDFVQPLASENGVARVRARTYERGVEAETLACGTGALASAVVARLAGQVEASVIDVEMPGGTLRVGFRLEGESVQDLYLEGPAVMVYQGTFEL